MARLLSALFMGMASLFVSMAFVVGQAQSMAGEFHRQPNTKSLAMVDTQATTGTFLITVTDQTPLFPLPSPDPGSFQPRYISGFGLDGTFTVFFEDRDNGNKISFNRTTNGPLGFSLTSTATNIADTHFVVKDWPITISSTLYAYRGWASVDNNDKHHFYVSDNLITWTLVSTFTIPNAVDFTGARGSVFYGFHDVILLNGTYYAFAEANSGQTMLVSSTLGADDWIAFDSVGGTQAADGPLQLPESGTPSGSFVDLGHNRGYGKVHVRGSDTGFYLAINPAAKAGLTPPELEAAFIDPANWMWNDGTTGLPTTPILTATTEHDLREAWVVPQSNPDAAWVIIYDADFGAANGGKALGYAGAAPETADPQFIYIYLPVIFKNPS